MIKIISKLSDHVIMVGNYYKGNAIGGMASVVRSYEPYFESWHYLSSWRDVSKIGKIWYASKAYLLFALKMLFCPKYKILHVHVASASSFYRKAHFIKLAKRMGRKVIFHMHSAVFKEYFEASNDKAYLLKIMCMADSFIALSQSWKEYYASIGVPNDKIVVINNPVDYPKKFNYEKDAPIRMLFLGELLERKGVWDVLKAINDNKEAFRGKVKLKIGGNKRENDVISFISKNALTDIVEFEGWVAGDKKWKLLNWANLVILPSFNEGLPITLLEAMAYSCALISTPVGGIPEILEDRVNGLMVTPGNSIEIANAIAYFINNNDKCDIMGQNSYQKVAPFLPVTVFKQLSKLYSQLLNN